MPTFSMVIVFPTFKLTMSAAGTVPTASPDVISKLLKVISAGCLKVPFATRVNVG